jgi:hypothetical protein
VAVAIATGLEELGAEEQVELVLTQLLVAVLLTLALEVEETTRLMEYLETVGLGL